MRRINKTSKLDTSKEVAKENKNFCEDYKKAVFKTTICNFTGFICVIVAYYFTKYLEPVLPVGLNMTICSVAIVILFFIVALLYKKL